MKKLGIFLLIAYVLCSAYASAVLAESSVNGIWIQIQEGMEVFLPENWVALELTDEMKAEGVFYAVVSPDGTRTCRFSSDHSITDYSPSVPTELRDWFADDVNAIIPRGAIFTVKDVNTGMTFEVHRLGGANHLEAEPLTAEDTAVMKAVGNGRLDSTRRPILVQYAGHVYAASMTTRPSGVEWKSHIRANNFAGTFRIHFKNSQTAVENKVDAAHQNAVQQAALASW